MKYTRKIKFQSFILLISLIFGFVIIVFTGAYLYSGLGKTFAEMVKSIEDNNFQQSIIDLNSFYTQAYNAATFLRNDPNFLSMLKRSIELNRSDPSLTADEVYERYKLQDDIKEFIHKIVIQNRILSLHYDKQDVPLYKEIAIFTENNIISAEGIVTKADANIFYTVKENDNIISFISYDQLKKYGIKFSEGHLSSDPIGVNENPPCILINIMENGSKMCNILIVLNNGYIDLNIHNSGNVIIANENNDMLYIGKSIDKFILDNLNNNINDMKDKKESEFLLSSSNKKNKYIIRESMLNIGGLYAYCSMDAHDYELIKKKQSFYLMLSIGANLILIFVLSQYQTKKIINPINKLNKAILSFPEEDLDMEIKDETNNYKKAVSLYERLINYFIITTIIPFVLVICSCYFVSMIKLKSYITDYSESIAETEASTISKIIEKKEKSFFMFINEPYVTKSLMHENHAIDYTKAALDKGVFMGIGKSRIALIDASGKILLYNNATIIDDLSKKSHVSENLNSYEKFLPIKWEMERDLLEEFTLVLNVPLFYKYDTKETKLAGTAAIFIDLWEIEEILYKSNIIERQVFLIDQNNKVFDVYNKTYLPENKNETMKILNFNSKDKMQVAKNIKGLNWQVVSIFSKNYIDDKTTLFKKDCMYCIFIIVLLSIAYSFFISYRILKPINQINYYINTVELDSAGDININEFYIDEIDNIGKNFVMMMERIEKLVDELMVSQYNNLILDKKGKKAQIKALQAEITPHFLYNTLDIIINLIHSMKTEKAISMIQALSDLFRYSITDNEMSSISIGEELRYAESYANILAVHYNEHVHFKWEIEPDIEAYECTRMFLQPLIENCVIHALGKDDLVVIIRCKRDGNGILFEVEDNGTGISETDLNNIRNAIKEENGYDLHVGLSNIYSRLKLLYGDSFSFDIQSSLGIGTIVAIKIPAKKISK